MAFRLPPIEVSIRGRDLLSKRLSATARKIKSVGRGMKTAGRAMTVGLTLPAVALGVSVLKTAGDFQLSMNRVRAITGGTGAQMAQLTGQARELGATTQFTASQAADAMGGLALAGFKTNEIIGAMPGTLQLAAAGQMDLATASDIASNILRGFGKDASELGQVNDVLVATFTNTNTTLTQLGEGMKFVSTIARSMEIPIEEVSAAMGILGNVGLKGAMAGTALRGVLAKLAAPSREAIGVLSRLRIRREDILDSKGNVRGLIDVVKVLEKSGASAGDLLTIFGQRAGPGMAGLVGQGSAKLETLTKTLRNSGGIAEKVAKVQMEGFTGAMREMRSAFDELKLAIADAGILEFMTDFMRNLADTFRNLAETNPALLRLGTVIAVVAAALGPLLFILGGVAIAIGTIGPTIALALPALAGFGVAISAALGPIALIVAGYLAWNVAVKAFEESEHLKDALRDWDLLSKTIKVIAEDLANLSLDVLGFGKEARFEPGTAEEDLVAKASRGAALAGAGELVVRFENAPAGTRTEIAAGGAGLTTELGLLPAGQ